MSYPSKLYRSTLFSSLLVLTVANTAHAQQGVAPPRPTTSDVVQVMMGEAPPEQERGRRAHHNKTHVKKDVTRDDTLDAPAADAVNQDQGDSSQNNPGRSN